MEGRRPAGLHLEMTDLGAQAYVDRRGGVFPDAHLTLFTNNRRDRTEYPRTIPEFDLLAVWEVAADTPSPPGDDAILGSHRFLRTPRPGQGSISGEPTNGLELVLISPRDPAGEQDLRDWGDHVHLRFIAEAAVPGFRMITPYRNPSPDGPRFLHFYEMHTDDSEAAFKDMAPRVADRFGGTDTDAYRAWMWHDQLSIDYVNTFTRVG